MKITFITGAGVSKESGIPTYRDGDDALWMNYKIDEVSTAKAWSANPAKVLEFHNMIRKKLDDVQPNAAHLAIAAAQDGHDVWVVTQNVDDLHERAGSAKVVHLHGQLRQARSSEDTKVTFPYDKDISVGDLAPDGAQARPDVVWFGEAVESFPSGAMKVSRADVVVVVGTSLQVWPACDLLEYVSEKARLYIVDPDSDIIIPELQLAKPLLIEHVCAPATKGVKSVINSLDKK